MNKVAIESESKDEVNLNTSPDVKGENSPPFKGTVVAKQPGMNVCPKCGSEYVFMIHRFFLEKLILRKHKYVCSDCGKKYFHHS